MQGCDCQICMMQCEHCKNYGCGMCNWCKQQNIAPCKECMGAYQNYLARLNAGVNANANVGINITFGTVLSLLFIAFVIYLVLKKR